MDIQIIGENMKNFKNQISAQERTNSIQKFWRFHYEDTGDINNQIDKYFIKLKKYSKSQIQFLVLNK